MPQSTYVVDTDGTPITQAKDAHPLRTGGVAIDVPTNFDSDYTVVVVAGATYVLEADNGRLYAGAATMANDSSINTPANIGARAPAGGCSHAFSIPAGTTSLFVTTDCGTHITGKLIRLA